MGVPETDPLAQLSLPPGFRFYPTDEELLVQYLCRKVAGHHFSLQIIGDIDLYKFDPWVLPSKAIFGEKEWYFFSPRDRKYPNGSRPNRVAGSGYWKATGTDKVITTAGRKVGIKKALVFYVGKAPKGTKTNWIMHEYRLLDSSRKAGSTKLDDWVLCRIYKKNSGAQKTMMPPMMVPNKEYEYSNGSSSSSSSHLDDVLESLPAIDDRCFALPRVNSLKTWQQEEKLNLQNLNNGGCSNNNNNFVEWANPAILTEFISGNQMQNTQQSHSQGMLNFSSISDVQHVPSMPPLTVPEDEVQSGVSSSGFYQPSSNGLTQGFGNSVSDPYGFRYPTQTMGFGFRQ